MADDYSGYGWIKVKKYKMDETLSWEDKYIQLEQHHIEETTFLINKVRELAAELKKSNDAIKWANKLSERFG